MNYRSQGHQSMEALYFNQASESLAYFRNWDMDVYYTSGSANSIAAIYKVGQPGEEYEYDTRGNVKKVTVNSDIISRATYGGSCGTSSQKHCNKPTSITDPNGNVTNYTYHASSGGIKTVRLPANKHGIRAKTTYNYQQFTANHNGPYSSAIWLLTEKITCANTENCATTDEIKVTYEYEPVNLQLVGESIHADGKVLRTCYAYDKYGNQITTMPPKDNINKTTCIN